MTQTRNRRCFTPIHCELHKSCVLAHEDYRNGYFTPNNVGEHCHHFQQIVFSDVETTDAITEKLSRLMGSHA